MESLQVSEVFYSLQGEGKTMGIPSVFIRLPGCNLMCGGYGTEKDKQLHDGATWRCDTIEVWRKGKEISFDKVLPRHMVWLLRNGAHLIVTGGEPLLHQSKIIEYLKWFLDTYKFKPFIEVETNGTIPIKDQMKIWLVDLWNCSPKLTNSGMPIERRIIREVIKELNQWNTIFKFVVTSTDTWREIHYHYLHRIGIDRKKIWLMPGADNIEKLLEVNKIVAKLALENQVNFCTRLQVEIWNQTTGV